MKRYRLQAEYKVLKELVVEVPDGADPHDETRWGDIIDEHDMDCNLYDVREGTAQEEK